MSSLLSRIRHGGSARTTEDRFSGRNGRAYPAWCRAAREDSEGAWSARHLGGPSPRGRASCPAIQPGRPGAHVRDGRWAMKGRCWGSHGLTMGGAAPAHAKGIGRVGVQVPKGHDDLRRHRTLTSPCTDSWARTTDVIAVPVLETTTRATAHSSTPTQRAASFSRLGRKSLLSLWGLPT
jgi:hypothetical protein